VEVDGKRLEVVMPAGLGSFNGGGGASPARKPPRRSGSASGAKASSGNALTSPMQGTIVKVAVADGDLVEAGDLVVVLEAMKMEQPLVAHRSGKVTSLSAEVGATVTSGSTLCDIMDPAE
jgi:acetyl-CoA/propionyl-CoA carboxylase biotin carboxyl carrier protein